MVKCKKTKDPDAIAKTQAANIMKPLQGKGKTLESSRTVENYEKQLKLAAKYCNKYLNCSLKKMTPHQATQYLIDRAVEHRQSTINMDRNALECMMKNVTGKLAINEILPVIKSEKKQILESRSYTTEQVYHLADNTNERNALSILICHCAGLRAHELLTISRPKELKISNRPARKEKFTERSNQVKYVVNGKGGLIREVVLTKELSDRLEARRLDLPLTKKDRGVIYKDCKYDISAGKSFSTCFSRIANRVLGWSHGAHGLRHTYAQDRMLELERVMPYNEALEVVSQEMGHFRPEITLSYLR